MAFTADQLRDVLQRHAPVVDMALEAFFPDPKAPISLDGLRPLAVGGRDIADVLITILEGGDLSGSLMAFLAARGIDIIQRDDASLHPDAVPPPPGTAIPEPVPNDFPLDAVGPFALRASAFRCRIEVSGITEGSGAFVSKRLVLTAAHVIDRVIEADEAARAQGERHPVLPQITVRASDGQRFPARCVWYSPVHDDERAGNDPPANEAAAHNDTALLQVGLPLGLSYGYCELPAQPVDWTGARLMTLVHYPDGNVKGLTRGRVLRNSPQDLRLRHDVNTEGGSSGGLAFDRDLDFIGIHQGRFDDARRLVPHGVFSDAPGFAEAIARDAPRRYLWSLGDDIEGQLVIGRQQFFAGLAKMLEDPATRLRGIWIRRLDTDTTTGLSFSFDMLEAFLANRVRPTDVQTSHATFKIPTDLEEEDLNHRLAEDILGARAAGPRAGVRTGETSDIAAQRDRAVRLAEDLQKKAAGEGATYWIFFEPPPDDKLSDAGRIQFEHLVEWLVTHPNLRVILAGFEQYALAPLKFQHPSEADTARKPGLLVDPLGQFTDTDVKVTLTAMLADLAFQDNVAPDVITRLVGNVTRNMATVAPGVYPFTELPRAVKRIRNSIKLEAGID